MIGLQKKNVFETRSQAITEENMRQTALLVRNICQPKVKLSDGKHEDFH